MVEEFASNPESFVMSPKAMSDHCISNSSCFKRCARINPFLLLSTSKHKSVFPTPDLIARRDVKHALKFNCR